MRISDWSSDVCSSDLFGGRERQRRVPAQLRGIIDVAAGQPPYPVVAIRAARAGAQMIDQMAETGTEAFDQPRTRRLHQPRPLAIGDVPLRHLAAKIGEDLAVGRSRLERRAGDPLLAIADHPRTRKDRKST